MNLNKNFPSHVGIIMDGNGRWASRRHLPRLAGHRAGVDAIKRTIEYAEGLGIQTLTFFAFSTENWKRDKEEIDGIFEIVREYVGTELEQLHKHNIKITTMGDISKIPNDLYEKLIEVKETTKNNTGLVLNLAINYGARSELVMCFNKLIEQGKTTISEEDIAINLYSKELSDPDLIIRTSGEQRLSNFMLYQASYSELYFTKTYWPSFKKRHFMKALKTYSKRERRFGGNHKR
ncbi:MAG: di-trans,poly-cis-decaprenylcistransferase [Clostridia bacterium]|nr:di-trans,poly-cis-decaprenylcistransferase [Clostridia bacterium]